MTRPRLLDAYSCAGGAGYGYHLAGIDRTGQDKDPQQNYPIAKIQGDAPEALADHEILAQFDAIHASPTCQTFSRATALARLAGEPTPDLLTPTLALLADISIPWVVENVLEACPPLRPDYMLCGTPVRPAGQSGATGRSCAATGPPTRNSLPSCQCYLNPSLLPFGHKGERAFADAMGCTWMSGKEGRQAIPPAMTEHIGRALIGHLAATGAAA